MLGSGAAAWRRMEPSVAAISSVAASSASSIGTKHRRARSDEASVCSSCGEASCIRSFNVCRRAADWDAASLAAAGGNGDSGRKVLAESCSGRRGYSAAWAVLRESVSAVSSERSTGRSTASSKVLGSMLSSAKLRPLVGGGWHCRGGGSSYCCIIWINRFLSASSAEGSSSTDSGRSEDS
eukprot:scaffold37189_cov60-Phaeocystis_antarctica.AAC.2